MLKSWGLQVDAEAQSKMVLLLRELCRWNKSINLTAIKDEAEGLEKHVVDSLCLLPFLAGDERVLDVGSGGGFPSLPLKLALPKITVSSVDSVGKKIHFQKHAARLLNLNGYEPLHGRVEDLAQLEGWRHSFDVVVSRAFTSLSAFCRCAMPFLKEGGRILAMKGAQGEDELKREGGEIEKLGLTVVSVSRRELPLSGGRRVVIELRKKTYNLRI